MARMVAWLGALVPVALAAPVGAQPPVETLCSGVGVETREAAETGNYTLRVEVAQADGSYLGDVAVRVTRDGETVAEAACDGPWFLAELPAGRYTVETTHGGRTQSRAVDVPGEGRSVETFIF